LQDRYEDVIFTGAKKDRDLSRHYASADCFVFPSRTDTFGLVLLEAMASGVPVAAYPVQGSMDVVADSGAGILCEDLGVAALCALNIPRKVCRSYASSFTWKASAEQFLAHLPAIAEGEPIGKTRRFEEG
jgi:glycosyltransferase involved in cell wall biosynthesis